jgi:hypothetical protein
MTSLSVRVARIAGLAAATAGILATAAHASPPKTVAVTPNPINDLIVRDGNAAWCSQMGEGDDVTATAEIWVQNLGTGVRVKFDSFQGGDWPAWVVALMAFDGDRAVWLKDLYGPGGSESYVYTDALSDRHHTVLREFYDEGFWTVEPDGTPLLYGVSGGLRLVEGRTDRRVPRIQQPSMASATKSRIAVVRTDPGAIELRRLPGGTLVRTIPVDGSARAVSLTPHRLTVLVANAGKVRLARYRLSGELVGSTAVPLRTRARLDADGKWVVFSAGKRIMGLNGETGKVRGLRWISSPLREVQANAGRVYWAANWGGHGHVRSLSLPAG